MNPPSYEREGVESEQEGKRPTYPATSKGKKGGGLRGSFQEVFGLKPGGDVETTIDPQQQLATNAGKLAERVGELTEQMASLETRIAALETAVNRNTESRGN
jgi:hypothetical protein